MSDVFGQIEALKEYAPRAPDEKRGDPGEADYLRYMMLNEHAKVAYLLRRKAAAEHAFRAGYEKAAPLPARLPSQNLK